jgi:hypothetical protein
MEWKTEDILKVVTGGGLLTLVSTIIARAMGWIRFGKTDKAKIGKVQSETALDIATISEKEASKDVRLADTALQWNINLASQLEKAIMMNEKKQEENDRLHDIIIALKHDYEKLSRRVSQLEMELERAKRELTEKDKASKNNNN